MKPDQAWQEEMTAAVRDQSDAREDVAEARFVGGQDDIARKRQVAPHRRRRR
jgi:hypothetical protein